MFDPYICAAWSTEAGQWSAEFLSAECHNSNKPSCESAAVDRARQIVPLGHVAYARFYSSVDAGAPMVKGEADRLAREAFWSDPVLERAILLSARTSCGADPSWCTGCARPEKSHGKTMTWGLFRPYITAYLWPVQNSPDSEIELYACSEVNGAGRLEGPETLRQAGFLVAMGSWLGGGFALNSGSMVRSRIPVAIAVVGLACNGPDATSSEFTMSGGTPPAGTSTGESSSTGSSSSSSGSSSGSSSESAGTSTTEATVPGHGHAARLSGLARRAARARSTSCSSSRARGSWAGQDKLVAAAPDFISTIQAQFDDFDVHIMVVDSEKDWWVEECEFMTCGDLRHRPELPCGYIPTACDTPGRRHGLQRRAEHDGRALRARRAPLHHQGHPRHPGRFECIARVGTWGNNAMGDALVAPSAPSSTRPIPLPGLQRGFCATTRSSC
jgi:hypothetical protein